MAIQVKSRFQILSEMIVWVRNNSTTLTNFNPGSTVRAILNATASVLSRMYYTIVKISKDSRISTATGLALDDKAEGRSTIRRLGRRSSVQKLLFNGVPNTSVPTGTQVSTDSGIVFATLVPGKVGENIVARAVIAGRNGNVRSNSITNMLSVVANVTGAKNLDAAQGGQDAETDEQLRGRAISRIAAKSLGVNSAYQEWAKEANSDVIRVFAQGKAPGFSHDITLVHVVDEAGAGFTSEELRDMETAIQPKVPHGALVRCKNLDFTIIDITATLVIYNNYNLNDVKNNIEENLNLYLNWTDWSLGKDVDWADIFSIVNNTIGVADVEAGDFKPSSNVSVGNYSLPRLGVVNLTESGNIGDRL